MIQPVDICPVCHSGLSYRLYIDKAGKRYRRFECSECGNVLLQDAESTIATYTQWINDAEKRHAQLLVDLRAMIAWFNGEDVPPPHGMKPLREGEPIPVLMPNGLTPSSATKRSSR